MNRQELIALIKNKREFKNLDSKFVEKILEFYTASKIIEKFNKKDITAIVKKTRSKLREIYGAFLTKKFNKRFDFLKDIKSLKDIEAHEKILKLHISSKERLPYYDEIYEKIFEITGKPKSILDLGCGLNPFSLPFMKIKPKYFALELVEEDANFLQLYFDKVKIKGKAYSIDLLNIDKNLPEADICFIFKLLDTLECMKWDITENLLSNLNVKWIVASFATLSLSGRKPIRKRNWFERMIKNKKYETFSVKNEQFYIIRQKH